MQCSLTHTGNEIMKGKDLTVRWLHQGRCWVTVAVLDKHDFVMPSTSITVRHFEHDLYRV